MASQNANVTFKGLVINVNALRNFWNDDRGQDLIEYTLLIAFVALASAALFIGAGGNIGGIWTSANSQLAAANAAAT
jgi:Flp pilus assembly pilin Flp